MPLIIMSGFPASGKTTRATQLAEHLRANSDMTVNVVNEESLLINRAVGYKGATSFQSQCNQEKRKLSIFSLLLI
jgi:tRNA uridine 5-carbamoylmethylation protein Kti12